MAQRQVLWLFGLLLLAATQSAAAVVVNGVRASSSTGSNSTRIVLDMDTRQPSHTLFQLKHPDRVVIDIDGAQMSAAAPALPNSVGVLRSVRTARHAKDDDRLRIVLDLERGVQVRSYFVGPSDTARERLVIDLGAQDRQSTIKRARSIKRDIVIAVDPGHGGRDPGAIGKYKTQEKDVVLAIGRLLVDRINQQSGMSAFLVRADDRLIDHFERFEKARRVDADLFVSIHADAVQDRRARGSSVYALTMKDATDKAAARLAASQNASLVGGVELDDKEPDLRTLLVDLSMRATINASLDVGAFVLKELGKINKLHRSQVQQAGFRVLRAPDVPSILVETAYISNPDEERKLGNPAHQRKLANAVFTGIRQYFSANPPVDSVFANAQTAPPRTHTIRSGDTLSQIADRYRVSLASLRQENQLNSDRIRIGQVLRIPAGG
ncbi:MAG: N-acetylmuramoyl-L-alanine amidase [Pseudomonadota bacterium]